MFVLLQSTRENGGAAQRFGGYKDFADDGTQPELRTAASMERDAAKVDRTGSPWRGVTGTSPLFRLPYFDVVRDTLLDMMHIAGGVVGRHLVGMLTGARIANAIKSMKRSHELARARRKKADEKAASKARATNELIDKLTVKIAKARSGATKADLEKQLSDLQLGDVDPEASSDEEEPVDPEEEEAESHVSSWESHCRHGKSRTLYEIL